MTREVVIIAMKLVKMIIKVVIWRCSMILRNRLKERQGCARCQSAGDGKTVRSVKADNQSYRKGRLFAVSHSCINDCKSMWSHRGRSILFTGGTK